MLRKRRKTHSLTIWSHFVICLWQHLRCAQVIGDKSKDNTKNQLMHHSVTYYYTFFFLSKEDITPFLRYKLQKFAPAESLF